MTKIKRIIHQSEISDGNMHPNLDTEPTSGLAQKRFNDYCARRGVDPARLVGSRIAPERTDHTRVAVIDSALLPEHVVPGSVDPYERLDASGLVTADRSIGLFTIVGDCAPVLFESQDGEVMGLGHFGWRAICQGLGYKILDTMESDFNISPDQVEVIVGPSIGGVDNRFGAGSLPEQATNPDLAQDWARYVTSDALGGIQLDVRTKLIHDLQEAGVARIGAVDDRSTYSDPNLYSRRASVENGKARGNSVFIADRH